MFFCFNLCSSLKPVILVPGTYASVLKATGSNKNLEWYCPKQLDDTIVWVGEKYFIPPCYNCVLQWLTLHYDEKTGKQTSIPGYNIDVYNFGSVSGVTYLDRFMGDISFIPYFSNVAKCYRKHGFQDDVHLFGAPHDWRLGICGQDVLWPRLKDLVESVYKSTGQKVVLLGHSFGGYVCQHFASEIIPTFGAGWGDKYIDKVVELSPSFGGAGSACLYSYIRALKYQIEIKTKLLQSTIESLGCIHTHFYNYELMKLIGNPTIVTGPNGEEFKASDYPKLLIDKKKVNGENVQLLNLMVPYLKRAPKASVVKEIIFYNSALKTVNGFKVGDWNNDKTVTETYGRGDHTVSADSIEAYCNKIANKKLTKCIDLNETAKRGKHFGMLFDEEFIERFYQATQE